MITDDIIGSINKNQQLGNITPEDAFKLKTYVNAMWRYLYKHHKELEAFQDMTDESFMTEADIICEELEKARNELKEKDEKLEENAKELEQKDKEIAKMRAELDLLKAGN